MSHQKPTIANYKLLIRKLRSQKYENVVFRIASDSHQAKVLCKYAEQTIVYKLVSGKNTK